MSDVDDTISVESAVVLDVGGTTLRIGRYDAPGAGLSGVRRVAVDGMAVHPHAGVPEIQHRVVEQIVREVRDYLAGAHSPTPSAVGVAFAGPVARGGVAVTAPTIWGPTGEPLPLARLIEERLGVPVLVVNDLTAAAWRYADTDPARRRTESFCLITVSSGIGNKVFSAGQVMIDDDGYGGELGHWTCDPAPDALMCQCGGQGHLGAYASGRGSLAVAARLCQSQPSLYASSVLAAYDPLDAETLAKAVLAADPFATAVLRIGLSHLATAMTALFAAAGIRRFIIMGGFAQAIGARYLDLLAEELRGRECFGLPAHEVRAMVSFGEPDDDHGMIGVGRLLCGQIND